MSEKFKDYQKIDGDEHINRRLERNEHNWYVPETITEDLLEDGRVPEKEVAIEKLLEKNRTGGAEVITERQLDTAKDQFGSKHRNPEAYEGDINKIEEWRISQKEDPIEDEKYKDPASEFPKDKRWWEVKSPDGLKIAKKNVKEAGIYDTDDDENLYGDDFDEYIGDEDEFGDEYDDDDDLDVDFDLLPSYLEEGDDDIQLFEEISFEIDRSDGTPVHKGEVKILTTPDGYRSDEDSVDDEFEMWMSNSNHSELVPFLNDQTVTKDLERGVITFAISPNSSFVGEDFDSPDEDFNIIDASGDFTIVESSKKK